MTKTKKKQKKRRKIFVNKSVLETRTPYKECSILDLKLSTLFEVCAKLSLQIQHIEKTFHLLQNYTIKVPEMQYFFKEILKTKKILGPKNNKKRKDRILSKLMV